MANPFDTFDTQADGTADTTATNTNDTETVPAGGLDGTDPTIAGDGTGADAAETTDSEDAAPSGVDATDVSTPTDGGGLPDDLPVVTAVPTTTADDGSTVLADPSTGEAVTGSDGNTVPVDLSSDAPVGTTTADGQTVVEDPSNPGEPVLDSAGNPIPASEPGNTPTVGDLGSDPTDSAGSVGATSDAPAGAEEGATADAPASTGDGATADAPVDAPFDGTTATDSTGNTSQASDPSLAGTAVDGANTGSLSGGAPDPTDPSTTSGSAAVPGSSPGVPAAGDGSQGPTPTDAPTAVLPSDGAVDDSGGATTVPGDGAVVTSQPPAAPVAPGIPADPTTVAGSGSAAAGTGGLDTDPSAATPTESGTASDGDAEGDLGNGAADAGSTPATDSGAQDAEGSTPDTDSGSAAPGTSPTDTADAGDTGASAPSKDAFGSLADLVNDLYEQIGDDFHDGLAQVIVDAKETLQKIEADVLGDLKDGAGKAIDHAQAATDKAIEDSGMGVFASAVEEAANEFFGNAKAAAVGLLTGLPDSIATGIKGVAATAEETLKDIQNATIEGLGSVDKAALTQIRSVLASAAALGPQLFTRKQKH